ncbi:hypothetical protein PROFUN_04556 [Planoprotostelium fungivorum]|uniref:UDENN domain-containing protein n=1 Tax=Planoprotostelium fungivorum TaxID=1890364 RepID=A0A2P6NBJ9_9EUKA|nr:hypothetical protein PROFUN_04556 [Planoprotostelium fungivorum]
MAQLVPGSSPGVGTFCHSAQFNRNPSGPSVPDRNITPTDYSTSTFCRQPDPEHAHLSIMWLPTPGVHNTSRKNSVENETAEHATTKRSSPIIPAALQSIFAKENPQVEQRRTSFAVPLKGELTLDHHPDVSEEHTPIGYSVANAVRPPRTGKIFEHFVIVGLPSNMDQHGLDEIEARSELPPHIIAKFPAQDSVPFEYLPHFCFPVGVSIVAVERTKSSSVFNEMMYGSQSKIVAEANSYIFVITGQDHLMYGVCIVEMTPLEAKPLLPEILVVEGQPYETRTPLDYFAPRCYCLLSRFPFFQLHFEVLQSIIARERLRKLNAACGIIESQEEAVLSLLRSYYEKEPPSEDASLSFQIPGELRSIEFQCPPGDEDKQLALWGVATTFHRLPLANILAVYRSLLLEKQVVLVSEDMGLLSAVGLSLLPIFRPYVMQGPFIPILPSELYECLEAPVPFLYGIVRLPSQPDVVDRLKKEALVYDLDTGKLEQPFRLPEPPKEELLYPLFDLQRCRRKIPSFEAMKKLSQLNEPGSVSAKSKLRAKLAEELLSPFRKYQEWLLDEVIIPALPTGDSSLSLDSLSKIEEISLNIPPQHRDFVNQLLRSQHFCLFTEQMKSAIDKKVLAESSRPKRRSIKSLTDNLADSFKSLVRTASKEKLKRSSGMSE